jgi:hypothetical protein
MFPTWTRRATLAVLSGIVLFATSAPVRADNIQVKIWIDNEVANAITYSGTNLVSFGGVYGTQATSDVFNISGGFGKRTQGTLHSLAQQGSLDITSDFSDAASHTLHIWVSATGFTSPTSPPPLNILDTVSGSLANGHVVANYQGFADSGNNFFGASDFNPDSLKFSFDKSGSSVSLAGDGSGYPFSPDGNPYSLSLFADLTLDAGTEITLTGGNIQAVATPAPAGFALVLAGLPVFGLAYLRRRRPTPTA